MNSIAVLIVTMMWLTALVDCRATGELRLDQNSAEGKGHIESVTAKMENLAEEKEFIMNIMDERRSESLISTTGAGKSENCTSENHGENQQHHMLKRSNELEKSSVEASISSEQTALSPNKWRKGLDTFLGFANSAKRLVVTYSLPVVRFLQQHIRRMLSPLPSLIYNNSNVRSAAASFTWSWIGDKLFTFLTRLQNIPHYKDANEL